MTEEIISRPLKKIPESFNKHGYAYELIERNDKLAIYCGRKESVETWEVMKIQTVKFDKKLLWGIVLKGDEFLPSTEQWGVNGFTLINKESAYQKFNRLNNAN